MAHYAFLSDDGIVQEVIVGRDESSETDWESYYASVCGMRCKRTSYNTQGGKRPDGSPGYRGNYAGIGYVFRDDLDAFIQPCPGDGWTLDEETYTWVNPSLAST
jgi:hypothetical protein